MRGAFDSPIQAEMRFCEFVFFTKKLFQKGEKLMSNIDSLATHVFNLENVLHTRSADLARTDTMETRTRIGKLIFQLQTLRSLMKCSRWRSLFTHWSTFRKKPLAGLFDRQKGEDAADVSRQLRHARAIWAVISASVLKLLASRENSVASEENLD